MNQIFIKKLREDAKMPERANYSDAGSDVFYCGEKSVLINPGESYLLGTGLEIATPHGYVCEVKNRSSMASRKQLIVGACVIDSGYDKEVMINIHNIGKEFRIIKPGDKIAQLIFYKVELPFFTELPKEEPLYERTKTITARSGGFGSSGER